MGNFPRAKKHGKKSSWFKNGGSYSLCGWRSFLNWHFLWFFLFAIEKKEHSRWALAKTTHRSISMRRNVQLCNIFINTISATRKRFHVFGHNKTSHSAVHTLLGNFPRAKKHGKKSSWFKNSGSYSLCGWRSFLNWHFLWFLLFAIEKKEHSRWALAKTTHRRISMRRNAQLCNIFINTISATSERFHVFGHNKTSHFAIHVLRVNFQGNVPDGPFMTQG